MDEFIEQMVKELVNALKEITAAINAGQQGGMEATPPIAPPAAAPVTAPPVSETKPAPAAPSTSTEPDYEAMDPTIIRALCKTRGIEFPKGTKTNTLIKRLRVWDVENAAKAPASAEESDPNPFDDNLLSAPTYTRDEVKKALLAFQKTKGNAELMKIFNDHNVKNFGDVTENMFPSFMTAITQ